MMPCAEPWNSRHVWGSPSSHHARRLSSQAGFVFDGPGDDPGAREKWLDGDGRGALAQARGALAGIEPFDLAGIEAALRGVVEARAAKPQDVFQPVRVALSGTTVSPGIFETIELLGKDETLRRIDAALAS